jgi:hypothetical protein
MKCPGLEGFLTQDSWKVKEVKNIPASEAIALTNAGTGFFRFYGTED